MVTVVSFTKRLPPAAAKTGRGTLAELMAKEKSFAEARTQSNQIETPTIMQGIGKLGQVAVNSMLENRADRDLKEQQDRQRTLMGQIDPMTGGTNEQIAAMGEFDPELMTTLWADRAKRQRDLADAEHWQPVTPEERASFGIPTTDDNVYVRNAQNGELKRLGGDGVTINNADAKAETAYGVERGKLFAKQLAADAAAGVPAQSRAAQLDVLDRIAPQMATGTIGLASEWARKNLGIAIAEGSDKTAIFESIIDGMAPKDRVEGSGSMSNYDAQQLKNALPNFVNSPEGIKQLTTYLRGMNEYNAQIARIAQEASMNYDDPVEGMKYYYEQAHKLTNPLQAFKDSLGREEPEQDPNNPPPPNETPEQRLQRKRDEALRIQNGG